MSNPVKLYLDAVKLAFPRVLHQGSVENLRVFPASLREILEVANGQRQRKITLLPSPDGKEPHLRLLSAEEIKDERTNNLGYNIVFKNAKAPDIVGVDLGHKFWKDTWWPIASSEVSWRTLFLASDTGHVFYQTWEGNIQESRIERCYVSASVDELFHKMLDDLNSNVFSILKDGVRFPIETVNTSFDKANTSGLSESDKKVPLTDQVNIIEAWFESIKRYESFLGATFGPGEPDVLLPSYVPTLLRDSYRLVTGWCWPLHGYDQITLLPPTDLFEVRDDEIVVELSKSEKVKPIATSELRFEFAFSDYHLFQIDFDPTKQGTKGQIVVLDFENETIDYFCDSIESFFAKATAEMNARLHSKPR